MALAVRAPASVRWVAALCSAADRRVFFSADAMCCPFAPGADPDVPPAIPPCRIESPCGGGPDILLCPADGVFFAAVRGTTAAMLRSAITVAAPGKRVPNGSPVSAGFMPIRRMMLSIFFAMRTIPTQSIVHGIMAAPFGSVERAESTSLTNIRLNTMSTHILANIRSQPRKISAVLFEPPMAKASGAQQVRTQRITYRSATSKNSRMSCHWITILTIMTMSQPALGSVSKVSSPNGSKVMASGACSISMTDADRPKPISQI